MTKGHWWCQLLYLYRHPNISLMCNPCHLCLLASPFHLMCSFDTNDKRSHGSMSSHHTPFFSFFRMIPTTLLGSQKGPHPERWNLCFGEHSFGEQIICSALPCVLVRSHACWYAVLHFSPRAGSWLSSTFVCPLKEDWLPTSFSCHVEVILAINLSLIEIFDPPNISDLSLSRNIRSSTSLLALDR